MDFANQNINPWVVAGSAAVAACVALVARQATRKQYNLPPSPEGVTTGAALATITDKVKQISGLSECLDKISGTRIMRLPLPAPFYIFHNGDPEIMRMLIAGDQAANFQEWDKPAGLLAALDYITNGRPTLVTLSTYATTGKSAGHAKIRKALVQSFSPLVLNAKKEMMQARLDDMCSWLDARLAAAPSTELEFSEMACKAVFEILCSCLFDLELGMLTGKGKDEEMKGAEFLRRMRTMTDELVHTLSNPLRPLMFWKEDVRASKQNQRFLREFAKAAIDKYRASHSEEEREEDSSILACMLRADYPSEEHRIADCILALLAGYDTSAYTICWCLVELCGSPAAYKKVMDEIKTANPSGGPATKLNLSQLSYLNQCVKESSRKWPMAGVGLPRQATEDTTLGGYDIPKGSIVMNVTPYIGRAYLSDGEAFVPERWEAGHKDYDMVNKYNVMFSQGRRNCIAQNLGNMQTLYTLVTLLQHYDFELASKVRPEFATTFKPCNLHFKITPRDGSATAASTN